MPKKKEETAENKGQIAENAEAAHGGTEESSQKTDTATAAAGMPENAGQPSEGSLSAFTDTSDTREATTQDEDMGLESLNVLADRHRVPTWQQAALGRLMGWEAGKMVSNADYVSALDKLKSRPVGGGRMG